MWDCLSNRLARLVDKKVCICGDFNAVQNGEERRSVRNSVSDVDYVSFNGFIDDNLLVDLPLHGQKYTWFKGDGKSMSRLDRFLLLEEWCMEWPNCIQVALLRGLSDHCALVMSIDVENWGPRPSRLLKCWQDTPRYKLFVSEKWKSFQISGWGGYVLKEKFKLIKKALKEWHVSHTLYLSAKITALKERQGEDEALTYEEMLKLHDISLNIHSLSRLNTSICWQQSRLSWLREGDANSKFFHSILSCRRCRNSLGPNMVNGVVVEGVIPVRQAVFSHFSSHFQETQMLRPTVEDLHFRTLSFTEGGGLIKPFSVEEVKAAICDCDSFKSPSPNGINFGFIKVFFLDLKEDII